MAARRLRQHDAHFAAQQEVEAVGDVAALHDQRARRRRCADPCRPAGTPGRWGRRRCTSGARRGCGSAALRGGWRRARSAPARTIPSRRRAGAGRSRAAHGAGRARCRTTPASRRGAPASARSGGRAPAPLATSAASMRVAASSTWITRLKSSTAKRSASPASSISRSTGSSVAKRRSPCSSKTATVAPCSSSSRLSRRRAAALGALRRQRVAGAHRRLRGARRLQEVQVELAREGLADLDPAHAVAALVERRGEDADAELPGQHGDDRRRRRRSWPACRRCRPTRRSGRRRRRSSSR